MVGAATALRRLRRPLPDLLAARAEAEHDVLMASLEWLAGEMRAMEARLTARLDTLAQPQAPDVDLTLDQAAERLGVSLSTAKRLIRAGELDSHTDGSRRYVAASTVDAYITTRRGRRAPTTRRRTALRIATPRATGAVQVETRRGGTE